MHIENRQSGRPIAHHSRNQENGQRDDNEQNERSDQNEKQNIHPWTHCTYFPTRQEQARTRKLPPHYATIRVAQTGFINYSAKKLEERTKGAILHFRGLFKR